MCGSAEREGGEGSVEGRRGSGELRGGTACRERQGKCGGGGGCRER